MWNVTETRYSNHCYSVKAISNTRAYADCVFVALGIQYAMRIRHIVVCGKLPSAKFFHIIS